MDEQQGGVLGWLRTGHDADPGQPADYRLAPGWLKFSRQRGLDRAAGPTHPGTTHAVVDGARAHLPPGMRPEDVLPNPSFVRPLQLEEAPHAPQDRVTFGACLDGRPLAVVGLEAGDSVYGTGLCAGPLERTGERVVCWNSDVPAYDERNEALYQSHPWVLVVRGDGTCFGVLADTTWRVEVDTSDGIRFLASGPAHGVLILDGPTPAEVLERLAHLTGSMPMPPRWALGYQQSRWSYYPDSRVRAVADAFREHRVPCDVIWIDIDYMDRFRVFTFDSSRFPDPEGLNAELHAKGFRTVWMIDPAPAAAEKYWVHDQGIVGGHATMDADGSPYIGEVWAGPSTFPDFTRPETRDWWAGLYRPFLARGIDGIWNDMNEPSVFDSPEKTLPERCWHRGGGEGDDHLPAGPHAMYHNVYGLLMARASREGMARAQPERRPFLLTRAGCLGSQRYAATWTGDNQASWHDLRQSIAMTLNLGLSGQPFAGPDIGGFIDHSRGDPDLLARWTGIGCMLPFARAHVAAHCVDKEPWALGNACLASCRRAIERRYRLLPYLYTCFREAHERGTPIVRPIWWADPTRREWRTEDRAFLLGSDVLVSCDVAPHGGAGRFDAGDNWRPVELLEGNPDPVLPQVFIRVGAIVPLGPVMQWTDERPVDPLELLVCPDENGVAVGELYEDDGDGHDHEAGAWRRSTWSARPSKGNTSVQCSNDGSWRPPSRSVVVRVLTQDGATRRATGDETAPIPA
jgi:alpha-glucosidase